MGRKDAAFRGDFNIPRFDITMDDVLFVGKFQGLIRISRR